MRIRTFFRSFVTDNSRQSTGNHRPISTTFEAPNEKVPLPVFYQLKPPSPGGSSIKTVFSPAIRHAAECARDEETRSPRGEPPILTAHARVCQATSRRNRKYDPSSLYHRRGPLSSSSSRTTYPLDANAGRRASATRGPRVSIREICESRCGAG